MWVSAHTRVLLLCAGEVLWSTLCILSSTQVAFGGGGVVCVGKEALGWQDREDETPWISPRQSQLALGKLPGCHRLGRGLLSPGWLWGSTYTPSPNNRHSPNPTESQDFNSVWTVFIDSKDRNIFRTTCWNFFFSLSHICYQKGFWNVYAFNICLFTCFQGTKRNIPTFQNQLRFGMKCLFSGKKWVTYFYLLIESSCPEMSTSFRFRRTESARTVFSPHF